MNSCKVMIAIIPVCGPYVCGPYVVSRSSPVLWAILLMSARCKVSW
jgi:hypothetical protein